MAYLILIALESLVVSLLLVAILVALSSSASRLVRGGVLIIIAGIGVALTAWILSLSFTLFGSWVGKSPLRLLALAIPIIAPYVLGVLLLLKGWQRDRADKTLLPRAAAWSRMGLTALFLAAIMLELLTLIMIDLTVRQTMAAVRVEAYTLAASVAPERPPESENAAMLYDLLFSHWHVTQKHWPEVYVQASEALTREMEDGTTSQADSQNFEHEAFDFGNPELGEFLRQRAGELALLRRAAALPACHFERDYFRPSFNMLLPQLSDFRTAGRLLALDARYSLAHGHFSQAIDDINALFGLARHSKEPFLVGMLVSISLEASAVRELENLLMHAELSQEMLARIRLEWTSSLQEVFSRSVRMEEATGLLTFCSVATGELPITTVVALSRGGEPPLVSQFSTFSSPWLVDDLTLFRELMSHVESFASLQLFPLTQRLESVASLDQKVENARWRAPLTSATWPSYRGVYLALARAEARRHVAEAGLAVYRYALRHNRLPKTLDELVPDELPFVPMDPADGHPLRARLASKDELILYSLGPDVKDDGGRPLKFDATKGVFEGDVRFVVRWAPARNRAETSE
ncbi:hypothetical protein THTE_1004 [Thermogutta terrifontis]|uniref:Uncharacterized protein n=1 Tax=Thermogutta terrifontis TaxID=1331910 RepID=A0A286RCB7_9BACT|nr:hypothetical protein [Thermogutta terrifontis]ASV73606.1 hypothetical protein THTE_1004 [Thermogutta terrifontis]